MNESIELKAVHKFHHKWSKKKIMVNVTLEMPEEIWDKCEIKKLNEGEKS